MTDTSEQLAQAFMAGAEAVHRHWLENPGDCPRGDPEFLEAALDYVASLDCTPRQLDAEVVARVQKQVEYVETHSLVIPCRLSLSDVKAMLEALA